MTKITPVAIAAHTEDPDDVTTQVPWLATTALVCDPGDNILKNRGLSTTYTSAGGTTITFGSYWDGAAFQGTGTGQTATNAYDGPYACVAPGVIDFTDEAFLDVEIFGDVAYAYDNTTNEYPVYLRSGDLNIHGQHIVNGAVGLNHLHAGHAYTGHFAGGTLKIDTETTGTGDNSLDFVTPNQNDAVYFVTDKGDGDNDYASGFLDGAFLINWGNAASGGANGLAGWVTTPMVGRNNAGDHQIAAAWPASGPALSMLTFCNYFPGSPSAASFGSGSIGVNTWCYRYCYYKSLSLDTKTNGTITHNGYTQTIETPLSTPLFASTGANSSVTFTIPAIPSGWDGVRVYLNSVFTYNGQLVSPGAFVRQVQFDGATTTWYGTATGSRSGMTFTFTNVQLAWVAAGVSAASHGFSAWPPGTRLAKDPRAVTYNLMKLAHVDTALDAVSKKFPTSPFNGGMSQGGSGPTTALGSLAAQHLNGLTGIGSFAGKGQAVVTDGNNNQFWGKINAPNGMHSKLADNTTNASTGLVPLADGSGNVSWGSPPNPIPLAVLTTEYGAISDDTSDSWATTNWNALTNAITALGSRGGSIYIPAGTYRFKVTSPLALASNITIFGDGPSTVLKVSGDSGNFANFLVGNGVKNVTIRDLCFHGNLGSGAGQNNVTPDTTTNFYRALWFHNSGSTSNDAIRIDNVQFDPWPGVHAVKFEDKTNTDITVTRCRFNFVNASGGTYDNTCLYLVAQYSRVAQNEFLTTIGNARTALEIVGGPATVTGNTFVGFRQAAYLLANQGGTITDIGHIAVTGNSCKDVNGGFRLWPASGYPEGMMTVSGNTIDVANATHNQSETFGIDITPDATLTDTTSNVVIANNTIRFQADGTSGYSTVGDGFGHIYPSGQISTGIGCYSYGPVTNLTIAGNLIVNAPAGGIGLGAPSGTNVHSNIRVTDNILVDPGCWSNASSVLKATSFTYQCGIALQGTLKDMVIENNQIISTAVGTPNMYAAISAKSWNFTWTRVKIRHNPLTPSSLPLYLGTGIDTGQSWNETVDSALSTTTASVDNHGNFAGEVGSFRTGVALGSSAGAGASPPVLINTASGFDGRAIDYQINSGGSIFHVTRDGLTDASCSTGATGGVGGVATRQKSGTPADADWAATPPNGTMVIDSSASKLWVRVGGTWKSATLT